jgi:aspartyl/asparaginyl beta-hydroxylase (cupin superfamily)
VWVTEMPATPDRVLEALEAKREARRDGKRVIFDEHLSVKSLSSNEGAGFFGVDA